MAQIKMFIKKIVKQTVVVLDFNLYFNLTNYEIKSLQIYFNKEIKSGSTLTMPILQSIG